jgi:hypothetical protein
MNRIRFVTGLLILVAGVMTGWPQETTNPGFDHDLSGWSVGSVPRHQWSPVDAHGSVDSGSLLAFKDYPATNLVRAQQCVPVEPGAELNFMVRALVLGTGDPADVYVDLTPHSDASCQSSTGFIRVSQTPPQDQWTRIVNGPYQVESGVQSVEVGLGLYEASGSTVPVSAHFDDAQFFLFIGDFETGTCSGWSASQPFCGTPEVGLRVEITWETSGDPDPGDEVGADLDVHLLHPNAAGTWLGPFDCYKGNANPDWGAAGPEDDPELIIQDDDGAGPEAIQITGPESVEYDIGVHYANDLGYGPSDATARVWIDGSLVYEYPDKALHNGQFWSLGTVAWPSGTFTVEDTVSSGIP